MNEYKYKVNFGDGYQADGEISVFGLNEYNAQQDALRMVGEKLHSAFPELDIEYSLELIEEDDSGEVQKRNIYENIVEITLTLAKLTNDGKIMNAQEISDKYSNGTVSGYDLIKDAIYEWAEEFEMEKKELSGDYISDILGFAKEKICSAFGKKKQYRVEYHGEIIVEAYDSDEACEIAMNNLSLDEVNAYEEG